MLFSTHITSDLDKCADNIIFIDHGKILLEEDKDALLDSWRLVKGDRASLTPEKETFLRCLRITDFGFTAVTDQPEKARQLFPEALFDRACVDDIMIALCEAGRILLKTGASCHRKLRKGGCELDESTYISDKKRPVPHG